MTPIYGIEWNEKGKKGIRRIKRHFPWEMPVWQKVTSPPFFFSRRHPFCTLLLGEKVTFPPLIPSLLRASRKYFPLFRSGRRRSSLSIFLHLLRVPRSTIISSSFPFQINVFFFFFLDLVFKKQECSMLFWCQIRKGGLKFMLQTVKKAKKENKGPGPCQDLGHTSPFSRSRY